MPKRLDKPQLGRVARKLQAYEKLKHEHNLLGQQVEKLKSELKELASKNGKDTDRGHAMYKVPGTDDFLILERRTTIKWVNGVLELVKELPGARRKGYYHTVEVINEAKLSRAIESGDIPPRTARKLFTKTVSEALKVKTVTHEEDSYKR